MPLDDVFEVLSQKSHDEKVLGAVFIFELSEAVAGFHLGHYLSLLVDGFGELSFGAFHDFDVGGLSVEHFEDLAKGPFPYLLDDFVALRYGRRKALRSVTIIVKWLFHEPAE